MISFIGVLYSLMKGGKYSNYSIQSIDNISFVEYNI